MKINGKDYKVKETYRGKMLFEEVTGKGFHEFNGTIKDTMLLLYCMIYGANPDSDLTIDELYEHIDDLDKTPVEILYDFLPKKALATGKAK